MALNVAQLLQVGSASTTGAVQVGAGLSVDANGVMSLAYGQPFPDTNINIPTTIPSSVPTTWLAPSTVIIATGCLEISNDNINFSQGPIGINKGNILYVRWIIGPSCSGAPHGTTITGTITDGFYIQSASFTIDRIPNAFTLNDLSSQGLSTTITSNPSFLTGFNVPAYVTIQPGATLGNVQASIGSTAFVGIPTTGTTLIINPNQSIQVRGDTGGSSNTTYSASIQVGDSVAGVTTDTWDVTTVSVTAAIAQPSITAPPNGSTDLNPAVNIPAGIPLTASAYTPLNGAGAQTSSQWEVYNGGFPVGPSSGTISAVNPGSSGTSGFIKYKTSETGDTNPNSENEVYGKLATDQFNDAAHPMFQWAKGLAIGGFTDWYIPAKNELEILYYNLKPTTANNATVSGIFPNGINPNAVPARNSAYTTTVPSQTSAILFRGSEAFSAFIGFWASTQISGGASLYAWTQNFSGNNSGLQQGISKADIYWCARAIRRIPIADYVAAGSPAIGTPLAGGFYGGQISTAGNSIADYALIVAPNAQGTYGYTSGTNPSLSIAGADTDGFQVGLTIKGDTSGATGIILAINGTTIEYLPTSGTFVTGETISTDPASYSPISGSPFTDTSAPFNTLFIPQSSLAVSSTYYSRVQYATTNSQAATSAFSAWSSFGTSSSFAIPPGTAYGGGYFAGQINVSGTIYNLIVAPVTGTGGQQGQTVNNVQYKTSETDDGGATLDEAYGGLATTNFADANHPMFNWCVNGPNGPRSNGGIGGFTDWYIPAKNELAILYFFLKPTTDANNGSSGSNPNSVAPYTPNTNYSDGFPNQTTSTLFQNGGPQALIQNAGYWSSTQNSGTVNYAWGQIASNGLQLINLKAGNSYYARAIRRIPA